MRPRLNNSNKSLMNECFNDFKPPNIIQNDLLKSFNIDEKAPVNYDPMVKQVMFNDKKNIVTSSISSGMVHTDKVTHALNMVNSNVKREIPWIKSNGTQNQPDNNQNSKFPENIMSINNGEDKLKEKVPQV